MQPVPCITWLSSRVRLHSFLCYHFSSSKTGLHPETFALDKLSEEQLMISRGSKVALGGAFCFAAVVIAMVHQMQNADRKRLREGVIRDLERQERKRRNIEELHEQIELTKKLQEQRDKSNSTR